MTDFPDFDQKAAAARRAKEPAYRRFPSLLQTIPAGNSSFSFGLGGIRAMREPAEPHLRVTIELEALFDAFLPQARYPYVWVINALSPLPGADGRHEWVHEIMVSYELDHMPLHAPIQFDHGKLICCDIQSLHLGSSPRFSPAGEDLVKLHCAKVYTGGLSAPIFYGSEEEEEEDVFSDVPH